MFKFISLISAVYFQHTGTNKYLGLSGQGNQALIITVNIISKAVDFEIREGSKRMTDKGQKGLF